MVSDQSDAATVIESINKGRFEASIRYLTGNERVAMQVSKSRDACVSIEHALLTPDSRDLRSVLTVLFYVHCPQVVPTLIRLFWTVGEPTQLYVLVALENQGGTEVGQFLAGVAGDVKQGLSGQARASLHRIDGHEDANPGDRVQ